MPLESSVSGELPGRKLGRHHLAFYRAWLQGVDLKAAAERFLETGYDLRLARRTLAWIRTSLAMAARRQGRHGDVRLLRLPLHFLAEVGEASKSLTFPTLAEFRAQRDPGGVYTERELTEIYLEAYPQAGNERAQRLARLIDRQLAALVWVEDLLVTDPQPGDSVAAWFDAALAARLILADIRTIGELHRRAAERYRWWVEVPRLGEKGAQRLVRWLKDHEATLGPLAPLATSPLRVLSPAALVRSPATALLPLESFSVPADLDGRHGNNRRDGRSGIDAKNDYEALQAWLAARAINPHTARAYRREAERLLLWAVLERRRALSSLTVEDATAYHAWLAALGRTAASEWPWRLAQAEWMSPRNTPRWSERWRPFEKPLSMRSQRQAYIILKALFAWLTKVRYLDGNPWDAVPPPKASRDDDVAAPDLELTHALTRAQWAFIVRHLDTLAPGEASCRLRFALLFAYATGLRLAELVDARCGRLYGMPLKRELGTRWMLKVLGKGGKWRVVPMPSGVMAALSEYLTDRGLDPEPLKNPGDTPLLARLGGRHAAGFLSPSMLYKLLKVFFRQVAGALTVQGHPDDAEAVQQATTHWLRHTRGSHSAESMPVNLLRTLLGHASVATTTIYTSVDEEALYTLLEQDLSGKAVRAVR